MTIERKEYSLKKLFLAALLAFATVPALADYPQKEITEAYSAEIKAYTNLDVKGSLAFIADGFTYKDAVGKVISKAQYAQSIKDLFANAKTLKVDIKFLAGKTVASDTVKQGFDVRISVKMKSGGTTEIHEVGVDTWKKIHGRWMEIKTVDSTTDEVIHK